MDTQVAIWSSAAFLIGSFVTCLVFLYLGKRKIWSAKDQANQVFLGARRKAEKIQKDAEIKARNQALKKKTQLDEQIKKKNRELDHKRRDLDKKVSQQERADQLLKEGREQLKRREDQQQSRREEMDARAQALDETEQTQREALERIAELSAQEAKEELMKQMEDKAREEGKTRVRRVEEEARRIASNTSQLILAQSMERLAPSLTPESTITIVHLPSDEMKGRIIGREGRNIRAFEMASGVDILIDETPGVIMLSCHNPYRREIAHRAILQLVEDGRIHPGRIEETVTEIRDTIDNSILEIGKDAAFNLEIHDLAEPIQNLLGRLKFKVAAGQNLLELSLEAALGGHFMATCLEYPGETVKRAGLLHNIGFVGEGYQDKHPYLLSAELAQRYGESAAVVRCIQSLHSTYSSSLVDHHLLHAARSLSLHRPGARKDGLDKFVERLNQMEDIATSKNGVDSAFVFRNGEELIVLVQPEAITDLDSMHLAREISREISKAIHFNGKIKVSVVRHLRATAFAH